MVQYLAPLAQTLLWVLLVGGIIWRFHRPLHGILEALERRIKSGSTVKAGPFELGAEVRPTPPEVQKSRADAELTQLLNEQLQQPQDGLPPASAPSSPAKLRSRFLQAEDLAIRAVETDFSVSINRQVSITPSIQADGAFLYENRLHLVEVKFIVRPMNAISTITRTLDHYDDVFGGARRRSTTIVLALVFEHSSDVEGSLGEFKRIAGNFNLDVQVRGYALRELREKYGFPGEEG